jgi:alanyl-tRNA synthetase
VLGSRNTDNNGKCLLDLAKRLRFARLHSSGHLIAEIVQKKFPHLSAVKAFHFPEGPYIEFSGILNVPLEEVVSKVVDELSQFNPQTTVNSYIEKGTRFIQVGELSPVPCADTHVKSIGEIGQVQVLSLKKKSGSLRLRYSVEE